MQDKAIYRDRSVMGFEIYLEGKISKTVCCWLIGNCLVKVQEESNVIPMFMAATDG